MNRLQQLIRKFSPNGVEFIEFGQACSTLMASKKINKKDYKDKGKYPIIDQGQNFIVGYTDDETSVLSKDEYVIFGDHTREIKFVNFEFAQGAEGLKILKAKERILPKYLYYALCNARIPNRGYNRHWNIVKNILFPLPPLPVQQEIVRILDSFSEFTTKLIEQLTAELVARKQQYEYYKDLLLEFNDNVKWVRLADIAEIGTGSSNTNEEMEDGKYPFFVRSQEVRYKNDYEFDETAIITSGDGVGVGRVFHYVEGKYALHQRAYRIHIIDKKVIPKYYFYYMKNSFLSYIKRNAVYASVTSVRKYMLENFPVPIPPLKEQQLIVNILDRFTPLINDLTNNISAEIEARQKQYEYYRDKLLDFKEVAS
ncbi:MAG: restriction endonuclease subunit S [Bacteroidales bacterium]|nr:restriction endonuclease subunit S [Bacteroidales bacterium]